MPNQPDPEGDLRARRTGRPKGESGLRDDILAAALRQFADDGFANTSVRSVAREAGVDPGLVRHYFGSKDVLLREVVQLRVEPASLIADVLADGPAHAGHRLAEAVARLVADEGRAPLMTAMLRAAATEEEGARLVRETVTSAILTPLAEALGADRPRLRAALAGSQVVGFLAASRIVGLEPLQGLSVEDVARALGPTFQRYLTGPID
ncbi:MAG: TetR family transcriptional regulator [Actinomycetota bacterium]|nr:TetR family transcriptional regulator [Actinomycetota bacterium]